jgi:hypothetical protein
VASGSDRTVSPPATRQYECVGGVADPSGPDVPFAPCMRSRQPGSHHLDVEGHGFVIVAHNHRYQANRNQPMAVGMRSQTGGSARGEQMAARRAGVCVLRVWREADGHLLAQTTHASGPDSGEETVGRASSAHEVEGVLNAWIGDFLAAHR